MQSQSFAIVEVERENRAGPFGSAERGGPKERAINDCDRAERIAADCALGRRVALGQLAIGLRLESGSCWVSQPSPAWNGSAQ